jgi:hypothetical protein
MSPAEPTDRIRALGSAMRVDSVTAEVVAAARAAGVRPILLKGPSLARWLYDDKADRPYSDTDLLVSEEGSGALEDVLRQLGFTVAIPRHELDRPVPAVNWIRRLGGAAVDVHLGLTGAGAPTAVQWAVLSEETESMTVGGAEVEVLSRPGRALHAILHLAQHGPELRPLRDAEQALARVPDDVWRAAAALAERLDALPAFAGGLRLAEGGAELAERLGLPAARSVEVILREEGAPLALGLKWLGEMPSGRARVRLVWAKLFPPPHEILRDPRGRTAPRLLAAYARNLLRLTRLIVPAWRALRHARRQAAAESAPSTVPNALETPDPDDADGMPGGGA